MGSQRRAFSLGGTPTGVGTLDHVIVTDNANGIAMNGNTTVASISNSIASNSNAVGGDGITVNGAAVTIDNDQVNNNAGAGIVVVTGTAVLSRSTITENVGSGIENGGAINTFQNNQIIFNGNGNGVIGNPLTPVSTK